MRVTLPVPSLDLPGSIAGPAENKTLDLAALLRAAIEETRTSFKTVAICLGVDQSYLTRMLAAQKPIPLEKLSRLPDDIERVFARRYAEALGQQVITPDEHAAAIGHLLEALGQAMRLFRLESLPRGSPAKADLGGVHDEITGRRSA